LPIRRIRTHCTHSSRIGKDCIQTIEEAGSEILSSRAAAPKIEGKVNAAIKLQRTANRGKGYFFTKAGWTGESNLPAFPTLKKKRVK